MPKSKKDNKAFIFNDENTTNSYGFKIPTKGIGLKRFKKNPVMLDSHRNSTASVLGKWEKTKADGAFLTGEPVFDNEDEKVKEISGKVERGFINSCSMGVLFKREDLKVINGELVLTKCELMEVSIVAIPSNSNAVRLYASDNEDKILSDEEIQNLCLSVNPPVDLSQEPKNKNVNMKIKLTTAAVAALGLTVGQNEIESEDLNAKVVALSARAVSAELKLQSRLEADEQAKLTAINAQVDAAVKSGQISADKKEDFVKLGVANSELLTSTLASIPVKKSLGAAITPTGGNAETKVETKEDFQKLSTAEQMQFKAENPDQYIKLFTTKK